MANEIKQTTYKFDMNDRELLDSIEQFKVKGDINGKIILLAEYDSIKKLGEYIIVKKDKKYYVYESSGKSISGLAYKKVRLERNVLEGYIKGEGWVSIID